MAIKIRTEKFLYKFYTVFFRSKNCFNFLHSIDLDDLGYACIAPN